MIGSIASWVLGSALSVIANAMATAASDFTSAVWWGLTKVTSINLLGSGLSKPFDDSLMIGILLTLALAIVEILAAALQRNMTRLLKVPVNILVVCVATFASLEICQLLLTAIDHLSAGIMTGVFTSTTFGAAMAVGVTNAPATVLVLATAEIIACLGLLAALMVRKVLVIVTAILAPIALSGATAESTRGWVRRWLEFMLALIFSKVVLALILVTGFSILQGAGSSNAAAQIGASIAAVGLLFIACFSPMIAMEMVHFTGGHFAHVASVGSRAASEVTRPAKKVLAGMGGAVAGGAAAGAATAARTGNPASGPSPSDSGKGDDKGGETGGAGTRHPSSPSSPGGASPAAVAAPASSSTTSEEAPPPPVAPATPGSSSPPPTSAAERAHEPVLVRTAPRVSNEGSRSAEKEVSSENRPPRAGRASESTPRTEAVPPRPSRSELSPGGPAATAPKISSPAPTTQTTAPSTPSSTTALPTHPSRPETPPPAQGSPEEISDEK